MFTRLPGRSDFFIGATTTVRPPSLQLPSSSPSSSSSASLPGESLTTSSFASSSSSSASAAAAAAAASSSIDGSSSSSSSSSSGIPSITDGGISSISPADAAAAVSSNNDNSGPISNYLPDDDDWWSNAIEEDTFESPLAFDASENGLWNGRFVPPPPRPPFLDDTVASDGLTTCDLCTWAWQRNAYSLDGSIETAGELGWAFTLIIVSIISALIGAIVMVIVLRCRRLKTANSNGGRPLPWWCRNNRNGQTGRASMSTKHPADSIRRPTSNSGVWTWLSNRRNSAGPDQIGPPSSSPAENHYTHMDDAYSPVGVGEALYAELDRESVRSGNPSYQNTAYSQCGEKFIFQAHDQDIPMVSSAPSSAYYSDLSVTAVPSGHDRAYEVVGLTVMSQPLPHWDGSGDSSGSSGGLTSSRRIPRLAAINETSTTTTIPSDYV